jgi:hypothetical protein
MVIVEAEGHVTSKIMAVVEMNTDMAIICNGSSIIVLLGGLRASDIVVDLGKTGLIV